MTVTFETLEAAFERVIEKNRKGLTNTPCEPEMLFIPAFFHIGDDTTPEPIGLVPQKLPFENIWLVTNYKGLGIVALCEWFEVKGFEMVRPDYLWYPTPLDGERRRCSDSEIAAVVTRVIDHALHALLSNHLTEVDSPVEQRINRGRMKAKNPPIPQLPPFIRVITASAIPAQPLGGTHASPTPHNRQGHWRTYKASGKSIWINDTVVLGGSPVARNYRVERQGGQS